MANDIFSVLAEMFSYAFLVRAFTVGVLVSACAALLGVSLVLKRYSMIGDGLSHVGFGALALATALNAAPLVVSIPVVIAAAFLLLRLNGNSKIKGDAAIALVSTGSLAVGVVIISRTTGMNTDVCNYLFGSILAMSKSDVRLSIVLSVTVLVLFVLFYNKLFAITFDETFARATGVRTGRYNLVIALLTAITIVLGMRMMGAMLISALVIFPALTSMRLFKTWRTVTFCSVAVSLVCFLAGIVISYIYAVPTGASVVLVNIAAFILFSLAQMLQKKRAALKNAVPALLVLALFLPSGCDGRAARPLGDAPAETRPGAARNGAGAPPVILGGAFPEGSPDVPGRGEAPPEISPEVSSGTSPMPGPPPGNAAGTVVEVREKMFIAQINDIYLNPEDYMGRTIRLEGLFKQESGWERDDPYCFVIRYGPGCCGFDGNAGFEVAWESGAGTYPEVDDWVEASGVLSRYEEEGYPYLYLALSSLRVLDERGAEQVSQ